MYLPTPTWNPPVASLTFQIKSKYLVWLYLPFKACLTPLSPSSTLFYFFLETRRYYTSCLEAFVHASLPACNDRLLDLHMTFSFLFCRFQLRWCFTWFFLLFPLPPSSLFSVIDIVIFLASLAWAVTVCLIIKCLSLLLIFQFPRGRHRVVLFTFYPECLAQYSHSP